MLQLTPYQYPVYWCRMIINPFTNKTSNLIFMRMTEIHTDQAIHHFFILIKQYIISFCRRYCWHKMCWLHYTEAPNVAHGDIIATHDAGPQPYEGQGKWLLQQSFLVSRSILQIFTYIIPQTLPRSSWLKTTGGRIY